jgi:excisionase family DNA binding protein
MKAIELLRIEEVAQRLRASEKTVRRRVAEGRIPSFKEGGRIFVLESDLDDYLQRQIKRVRPR